MSIPSPLGPRLKQYRDRAGLTQERAAIKLEVSPRTVVRWENEGATPSWSYLVSIAALYDCNVADLFVPLDDENGDPEPAQVVA